MNEGQVLEENSGKITLPGSLLVASKFFRVLSGVGLSGGMGTCVATEGYQSEETQNVIAGLFVAYFVGMAVSSILGKMAEGAGYVPTGDEFSEEPLRSKKEFRPRGYYGSGPLHHPHLSPDADHTMHELLRAIEKSKQGKSGPQ